MHSGRSRAFLRLQDGCDSFCSYCIVPYTRGKSRSLPAEEARTQLNLFLECGYREVVLTGIHLGQWGKDLQPARDLSSLLSYLAADRLPPRIRLSSLEPMEWSRELLNQVSSRSEICPHFHIPLQSGDGEVLSRMRRPYTPNIYRDLICELHQLFPQAALGADVMVGFPGETERCFQNTFDFISELPLSYLHVFPYSPRPGTPAAQWKERVTGGELKRRTKALQDLSAGKRAAFRNNSIGQCVEVLVESEAQPGRLQGTSENYLHTVFPGNVPPGSIVRVRILETSPTGVIGEMVD
jgi:threonylcarbamoyladenosine tRNA methylthiotransferase MtaB